MTLQLRRNFELNLKEAKVIKINPLHTSDKSFLMWIIKYQLRFFFTKLLCHKFTQIFLKNILKIILNFSATIQKLKILIFGKNLNFQIVCYFPLKNDEKLLGFQLHPNELWENFTNKKNSKETFPICSK